MKMRAIILTCFLSFAFVTPAFANPTDGFLHMRMKDGKFEKLQYLAGQVDIGEVLTKSKLMNVTVHNGESFLEYRAKSKDGMFTIVDKVGFGASSFSIDFTNITEMLHADFFYKDFKWQLSGPSIDSFYNVLAELDVVDSENVIEKTTTKEGDAGYSFGANIGNDRGSVACYVDRGQQTGSLKPPVKVCVFSER